MASDNPSAEWNASVMPCAVQNPCDSPRRRPTPIRRHTACGRSFDIGGADEALDPLAARSNAARSGARSIEAMKLTFDVCLTASKSATRKQHMPMVKPSSVGDVMSTRAAAHESPPVRRHAAPKL